MAVPTFLDEAKAEWVTKEKDGIPTNQQLLIGCLQRIAEALEKQNKILEKMSVKDYVDSMKKLSENTVNPSTLPARWGEVASVNASRG